MDLELLEKAGLTKSEVKVYLALIDLGSSAVTKITSKAKVASSKTYELLDKLIEKGLVTTYKDDNVRYFKAVDPQRLVDYIEDKKIELEKNRKEILKLLPILKSRFKAQIKEIEVELFKGYRGIETIFKDMIRTLNKGEEFWVIGGGDTPTTNPKTKLFFERIHKERSKRGIILKIIFSEARRKTLKKMAMFSHTFSKYLPYGTPSTINIYKDITILLVMSPIPAGIRIKDKHITESYKKYFEELWKKAKP